MGQEQDPSLSRQYFQIAINAHHTVVANPLSSHKLLLFEKEYSDPAV
jgi:hypothetical protein